MDWRCWHSFTCRSVSSCRGRRRKPASRLVFAPAPSARGCATNAGGTFDRRTATDGAGSAFACPAGTKRGAGYAGNPSTRTKHPGDNPNNPAAGTEDGNDCSGNPATRSAAASAVAPHGCGASVGEVTRPAIAPLTTPAAVSMAPLTPAHPVAGMESDRPPVYPEIARRRGQQGRVVLHVNVSAEGMPVAVTVAESSGYASLDTAALAAVQQWRFVPATRGGTPVPAVSRGARAISPDRMMLRCSALVPLALCTHPSAASRCCKRDVPV